MAKIVKKKKKKKLILTRFSVFFFLFSAIAYLCSALFLRTINNGLSSKKQELESQIADLQTENDSVKVVIQTLSSRDRVNTVASDTGLSLVQDNIITITTAGTDGE